MAHLYKFIVDRVQVEDEAIVMHVRNINSDSTEVHNVYALRLFVLFVVLAGEHDLHGVVGPS